MTTYAGIAQLLVDIRMLTPEQAREHLDDHEELDDEDVPSALEDMGVAVTVHGEDVDDLEESYRYLLEQAADCSGGAVEINGVRLADGELHFVRNGKPLSWHVEHQSGSTSTTSRSTSSSTYWSRTTSGRSTRCRSRSPATRACMSWRRPCKPRCSPTCSAWSSAESPPSGRLAVQASRSSSFPWLDQLAGSC